MEKNTQLNKLEACRLMYAQIKRDHCYECEWARRSESYCDNYCMYGHAREVLVEYEQSALKEMRDADEYCRTCARRRTCKGSPTECIKDAL